MEAARFFDTNSDVFVAWTSGMRLWRTSGRRGAEGFSGSVISPPEGGRSSRRFCGLEQLRQPRHFPLGLVFVDGGCFGGPAEDRIHRWQECAGLIELFFADELAILFFDVLDATLDPPVPLPPFLRRASAFCC